MHVFTDIVLGSKEADMVCTKKMSTVQNYMNKVEIYTLFQGMQYSSREMFVILLMGIIMQ